VKVPPSTHELTVALQMEVALAHVWLLHERVLRPDPQAQRCGVTFVQDLSGFGTDLIFELMRPSAMALQAKFVHFLTTCFPIKFGTLVVVDAPSAFWMLWRVVSALLPVEMVEKVHFLYRPTAAEELASLLGVKHTID